MTIDARPAGYQQRQQTPDRAAARRADHEGDGPDGRRDDRLLSDEGRAWGFCGRIPADDTGDGYWPG